MNRIGRMAAMTFATATVASVALVSYESLGACCNPVSDEVARHLRGGAGDCPWDEPEPCEGESHCSNNPCTGNPHQIEYPPDSGVKIFVKDCTHLIEREKVQKTQYWWDCHETGEESNYDDHCTQSDQYCLTVYFCTSLCYGGPQAGDDYECRYDNSVSSDDAEHHGGYVEVLGGEWCETSEP